MADTTWVQTDEERRLYAQADANGASAFTLSSRVAVEAFLEAKSSQGKSIIFHFPLSPLHLPPIQLIFPLHPFSSLFFYYFVASADIISPSSSPSRWVIQWYFLLAMFSLCGWHFVICLMIILIVFLLNDFIFMDVYRCQYLRLVLVWRRLEEKRCLPFQRCWKELQHWRVRWHW